MAVPDYQSLMLPVLMALADGSPTPIAEIRNRVAASERLTAEDVREMLPSGKQTVFAHRVSWAVNHLMRAGLVKRTTRAMYQLTPEGKRQLSLTPSRSDVIEYVMQALSDREAVPGQTDDVKETPEEVLDRAAGQLRGALEAEILDRVRNAEPDFLERVVVDLLIAMGYGGGDSAMGRVTGGSGDGGIDGMIREDALGLDMIYVQAKRYGAENSVGVDDLRKFAGAIDAAGTTNKGVFVTTSSFTDPAKDFVKMIQKRIILIDGPELARLMVHHGIGVRTYVRYEVKRVDEDYFDEEAL